MPMRIPVPEVRHSLHVVATPEPIAAESNVPAPPLPAPALLRRFGADAAALEALAVRTYTYPLFRSGRLERAHADVVQARLEALQLASEHDGLVIDLAIPRIVTDELATSRLEVANQWVAFDLDGDDVVSHGLMTFGLPELRCTPPDPQSLPAAIALLTGLSHRLILEWPDNDPLGRATITLADVAQGLGQPQAPSTVGLEVSIDLRDDELLIRSDRDPRELFTA